MNIPTPYLVFLGDAQDYKQAKTAFGISEWRPELCIGQQKLAGCQVDLNLPDMSSDRAFDLGARTFLIAISPFSTTLPDSYIEAVGKAMEAGLNVANPLHGRLPEVLIDKAKRLGVQIYNFRHREEKYPKGTGKKRTGLRLLTVGTDCCCGKKFTALSIHKELTKRGVPNTFRSTGQTGFLISQSGINNDTIQADFLSGAAEWLTPENSPEHWDIVEGQGALSHPSFGAGSFSLLYGTQPDYIVMCHEPGRKKHRGVEAETPDILSEIIEVEWVAQKSNPKAKVVAVSLFTKYADKQDIEKCLHYLKSCTSGLYHVFDPSNPSIGGRDFINLLDRMEDKSNSALPNMDKSGQRYV